MSASSNANPAPPQRTRRPLAGILCLLTGFIFLVLSDASAKWLIVKYPITEVVGVRAGFVVLVVVILTALRGRLRFLKPVDVKGQLQRGVFAAFSGYLFITGLAYVALVDAAAAAYMGPIIMTALAPKMLGEHVGIHRWLAVVAGFAGMLIMLRPTPTGISWAMLLPASAAVFGALRDLKTRSLSATDDSASILMISNLMLFAVGIFAMPWFSWLPIAPMDFGLLIISGILIGFAHFLHIEAFRLEEASALAPFRYTGIIWSAFFGFLIWGHVPDRWIVVGALVVIGSGLYIVWRERQRMRASKTSD